jgi:hypothetical protein
MPRTNKPKKKLLSEKRLIIRILTLLVRAAPVIKALLADANVPATRRRAERWLKEFETGLTDQPLKWF